MRAVSVCSAPTKCAVSLCSILVGVARIWPNASSLMEAPVACSDCVARCARLPYPALPWGSPCRRSTYIPNEPALRLAPPALREGWHQARRSPPPRRMAVLDVKPTVPRQLHCCLLSVLEALHRDNRVGTAEREGIANGDSDRACSRIIWRHVEIAFGI